MLMIRDYIKKFEEQKAELAELLKGEDITPQMVLDEMSPAERKLVDMLGGEVMVNGIIYGTVNEYGENVGNDEQRG